MDIRQPTYRQIFTDENQAELACAVWASVIEHLKDKELVSEVLLRKADRYVRAYVDYEKISPTAISEGPVKAGPNGGDVFNFNWSALEKINDRLAKFEVDLHITPPPDRVKQSGELPPQPKKTPSDEFLED